MSALVNRIKIKNNNNTKQLLNPKRNICHVCTKCTSKYVCPRCKIPYCSLNCYRQHDMDCTEEFYKEWVDEEMNYRNTNEGSKPIFKVTNPCNKLNNTNSENVVESEERRVAILKVLLNKIKLGQHVDLNDLDVVDRNKFMAELIDGQLSNDIEQWLPWWDETLEEHNNRHHIQPSEQFNKIKDFCIKCNDKFGYMKNSNYNSTPMPQETASMHLENYILDVIFVYITVIKRFNGQWKVDPISAASLVLRLSNALEHTKSIYSVDEIANNFYCNYFETFQYEKDLRKDIINTTKDAQLILKHEHYVLDLLIDVYNIFNAAIKLSKKGNDGNSNYEDSITTKHIKTKYKFAKKKIVYFINWVEFSSVSNVGSWNHIYLQLSNKILQLDADILEQEALVAEK